MDEKEIKEILDDPNTWEWDGCTYPEDKGIDTSYLDKTFEEIKERARAAGVKVD